MHFQWMFLHIMYHFHKVTRFIERIFLIAGKIANHFILFEHHFFNTKLFCHTAKCDGLYKFLCRNWYGAKSVNETLSILVEFCICGKVVKFFIEKQPLTNILHIAVWDENFQIGFYLALFYIFMSILHLLIEELLKEIGRAHV